MRDPSLIVHDRLKLAVFDVDGTLYRTNTAYGFLEYYFRGRSTSRSWLFRSARTIPGKLFWYAWGFARGGESFRQRAVASLAGEKCDAVRAAARAYVASLGAFAIPATMELLRALERDGYVPVLVSGSLGPVIEAIASELRVVQWHAMEPEASDGVYTGRIAADVRGDKLATVRRAYANIDELAVITDNENDMDILGVASRAWVVRRRGRRWRGTPPANAKFLEV